MNDDINYAEKISTFNLLVGNTNEDIALNYLTIANWDETQAAILYNKENKGSDAKLINPNRNNNISMNNQNNYINNNYININNYSNPNPNIIPLMDDFIYNYAEEKINPGYKPNPKKASKLDKYREFPIFKEGIFDGFKFWKEDNRAYCKDYFQDFKNCMKSYETFIIDLKTKVGIIYLYDKRMIYDSRQILKYLYENEQTKDLLNQRCVLFPIINKSNEASKIIKTLKIKNYPVLIICFYKNQDNFAIISYFDNIKNNIPLITEKLIEAHELFNDKKNVYYPSTNQNINPINNNNNQINNPSINNNLNNINNPKNSININNNINNTIPKESNNIMSDPRNYMMGNDIDINNLGKGDVYPFMSDGDILKKQEEEMKSLERKEEEKIRQKKEEERKKKEEEEKQKNEELKEKNLIESLIKQLPEEPSDDDPNKCIIMFRFPDGEKTVQRKFLKTEKISMLYLYVKSLGREIYSEKNEKNFSLVQPFPFKNYNELQDKTLEEEGMFPNAVLQIRTVE